MVATHLKQTIDAALRQWEAHYNKGDMAGLAGMYATDATLMPPDSEAIRGREGIEAFWRAARDSGVRRIDLHIGDVFEHGDVLTEISRATLTVSPEAGDAQQVPVKYVVLWKRQADGRWQLFVHMWNSTGPA